MTISSQAPRNPPSPPAPEPGSGNSAESRPDDLLNINEIAVALRVSKMTVYRFIHHGHLPALRVGRSFRVYRGDLEAYLGTVFLPGLDRGSGADSDQAVS